MKISETAVKRPVATVVVFIIIALFGILCYRDLGIDEYPDIEFPTVTVTCVYRGASPETIETKIVEKIEEQIAGLNGVDNIRSTCAENMGFIIVSFKLDRDVNIAAQDVRDKISAIRRDLPEAMDSPVVEKFDTGALPIITLGITGPMPVVELSRYAKDIVKPRIQRIPGVGSIKEMGIRDREIKIWIDNDKLNAYRLTAAEIVQAIKSKNIEIPAGKIEDSNREFVVKTMGELDNVEAFRRLVIATIGGTPITLGEIAQVEDSMQDEHSSAHFNGIPTLALQVQKQSGANVVKVAKSVKEAIRELLEKAPVGIEIRTPIDSSPFIENSIKSTIEDVVIGGILAILVILFFLRNWRSTIISGLSIPTSILASFIIMKILDLTLNLLTTMALSLAIGMLVDDAIVVIENIYRHMRMKKSPKQAAADATAEIGTAVMTTASSLVSVFLPVALMSGLVGRFLYHFGIMVTTTVVVSLIVSFTLTPMLAARYLSLKEEEGLVAKFIGKLIDKLDSFYRLVLEKALCHRIIVLSAGVVIVLLTAIMASFLSFEFKPPIDKSLFMINFRTPIGTSIEASKRIVTSVEHQILEPVASYVDCSFSAVGFDQIQDPTKCMILVNIIPKDKRPGVTQFQIMEMVRKSLEKIPGIERSTVEEFDLLVAGLGGGNQTLSFSLLGSDLSTLSELTDKFKAAMKQAGGYVDVIDSREPGKPELQVQLLRNRMEALGINVEALAVTLNLLISGEQAISQFKSDGKQYDIKLRLMKEYRENADLLTNLRVRTIDGAQTIPLSNVTKFSVEPGPALINRYNRAREITVGANLENKSQGTAMQEIAGIAKQLLPVGYGYEFQGLTKTAEETIENMVFAALIAITLVYLLLAAQFENFLHPLTIMASVPLALVGAIAAILLMKARMNILTCIGFLTMMGLVVKNGILLVEFINQKRSLGMNRREAILSAAPIRLAPILMTSISTIGGMLPVAIATGPGAEMRTSMAIAVIGGLTTSTILTLLFVPVIYEVLEDVCGFFGVIAFRNDPEKPESVSEKMLSEGIS
jgi:HAE1 family hydrophobic/amphiphilic exporter-1